MHRSGDGMIDVRKQSCRLLPRILYFVPYFDVRNSCNFIQNAVSLDQIWSQCCHLLVRAADKEASLDEEARKELGSRVFVVVMSEDTDYVRFMTALCTHRLFKYQVS